MIISPAQLNKLARKVGPSASESIVDIKRSSVTMTDFGPKATSLTTSSSDVPARFQYIGDYLHTGEAKHGLVRIDADVIVSIAATADVRPHDVLVKKSLGRQSSRYYSLAQTVTVGSNHHICVKAGVTGSEVPDWKTSRGEKTTDGDAEWRCEGPCEEFVVTEMLAPRTYGDYISRQVYAKYRQDDNG